MPENNNLHKRTFLHSPFPYFQYLTHVSWTHHYYTHSWGVAIWIQYFSHQYRRSHLTHQFSVLDSSSSMQEWRLLLNWNFKSTEGGYTNQSLMFTWCLQFWCLQFTFFCKLDRTRRFQVLSDESGFTYRSSAITLQHFLHTFQFF